MILRGIDFGSVWGASGVQGFYGGDEYRYHRWLRLLGILDMRGLTFVAKTMTLNPNTGNMPIKEDGITPSELLPACVHVTPASWWNGFALNKVGLTNPGAEELLRRGIWQRRESPVVLSFMQIASLSDEPKLELAMRIQEIRAFVHLMRDALPGFRAPVALQINFSCPNTGPHAKTTLDFILETLDIASILDIPLIPKLAVDTSIIDAAAIAEHPACDAICISNTVSWGSTSVPNWQGLFGSPVSPLAHLGKPGGGGLSGAPLLPLVEDWITQFRKLDPKTLINGGGGILKPKDARRLIGAGANSVFLGSVAFLRPWRVQSIIRHASLEVT